VTERAPLSRKLSAIAESATLKVDAKAKALIEARQYVLDSDWGDVQPDADAENRSRSAIVAPDPSAGRTMAFSALPWNSGRTTRLRSSGRNRRCPATTSPQSSETRTSCLEKRSVSSPPTWRPRPSPAAVSRRRAASAGREIPELPPPRRFLHPQQLPGLLHGHPPSLCCRPAELTPLPVAPRQIPYHAGFNYFELETRGSEPTKTMRDGQHTFDLNTIE